MELTVIRTIARREFRDALKNRWLLLLAGGLAVLAIALSRAGLATTGYAGLGGFGRTAASLINALVLFVPLLGIMMGAQSIVGERERGTLVYLLAQPVTRDEVFVGKACGLALSLMTALAAGFGVAALALASAGGGHAAAYLSLATHTALLALVSLGIGLLISCRARRTSSALGAALVTWLGLAFAGDLGLIGWAITFHPAPSRLLPLLLANPLQLFKLGAIYGLRSTLDPLGSVGQYAAYRFGATLPWLLLGLLLVWSAATFGIARALFRRRGVV